MSARELEVARLYGSGLSTKEIALELHITLANVKHTIYMAKIKFRNAGNDVHTKADVYACLAANDLLTD